jgi:hypothetical protein
MNTPPFRIGQKVVCVETNEMAMRNDWLMEKIINNSNYLVTDCYLQKLIEGGYWAVKVDNMRTSWDSKSFAPIEESRTHIQYVAVSESLREKAVEIAAVETN